jgi:hypothetical protein
VDHEDLLSSSVPMEAAGLELLVLDLPTLIEVKTDAGRAKDRAMLPTLIALLRETEDRAG